MAASLSGIAFELSASNQDFSKIDKLLKKL